MRNAGCLAALLGTLGAAVHAEAQTCAGDLAAARELVPPGAFAFDDFDADGVADLAVSDGSFLAVHRGRGDGTFEPPIPTPISATAGSFVVARLDADVFPDVAFSHYFVSVVSVYIGNGDGTFRPVVEYPTSSRPGTIVAADVDGDGARDLLTPHGQDLLVAVLLGNGDGTFSAPLASVTPDAVRSLAVRDFDGDGRADVVACSGTDSVAFLRGNGDGTFQAALLRPAGGEPITLTAALLDGDGVPDLAVALGSSDAVAVFLGDGAGAFLPSQLLPLGGRVEEVVAHDIDHDGTPDLVVPLDRDAVLHVARGNGDGTFGAPEPTLVGADPERPVPIDLDGDGDDDVVVATTGIVNTISVVRGRPDGTLVGPGRTAHLELTEIAPGDLDGDGYDDAALLHDGIGDRRLDVALSNGDGTFRAGPTFELGPDRLIAAAAVPLDADADLDLVVATDRTLRTLLGRGDGDFDPGPTAADGIPASFLVTGSVDGDGLVDVVTVGWRTLCVYLGRGGGLFQPFVTPTTFGDVEDAALADLDGDGDGDLALTTFEGYVVILLGAGDGSFAPPVLQPAPPDLRAIAAGDLDGDGDVDLVVGGTFFTGPPVEVLLNRGDGSFVRGASHDVQVWELSMADMTGDGVPDVVGRGSPGLHVLVGNGDGTLAPSVYALDDRLGAMELADVEGDGAPDVLLAHLDDALIAVVREGVVVQPPRLPPAYLDVPYAALLSASGGTPPNVFSIASGSLPPGLSLAPSGAISGTPSVAGSASFLVEARDALGCTGRRAYVLDVDAGTAFLVGQGLGPPNPNRVALFGPSGAAAGVDFLAFGAGSSGVNVAAADLDAARPDEILAAPGPGPIFGPQVRGFRRDGAPLAKVSFYAYGTLRFGANVAGGDLDADGFGEILSGPGPGDVFGPHVRGFMLDGGPLRPIAKVDFFAYATLRYGVEVATGDVDADGSAEILTAPGAGLVFSSHVRGFDHDGGPVRAIPTLSFVAFPYPGYGADVASGDVDDDGHDEIAIAPGPGPTHPAEFQGFDHDGVGVTLIPAFRRVRSGGLFGGEVGLGDVSADGVNDLLTGLGRDPAAPATVYAYRWDGSLVLLPNDFTPWGGGYGVNVAGGALEP